jgi:hypothetical protein
MRNKNTGKYQIHKYFKRTGHHFIGTGDTKEEAREDLKKQLAPYMVRVDGQGRRLEPNEKGIGVRIYYQLPMNPTGETVNSPGYMWVENKTGYRNWVFNPYRTVPVKAPPHIADARREELIADRKTESHEAPDLD